MPIQKAVVMMTVVAVVTLAASCNGSHQDGSRAVPLPKSAPSSAPLSSASSSVSSSASAASSSSPPLAFAIQDGRTDNRFFREGSVAAHLLATSGDAPRIVVAFPAGNMGVGLWFDDAAGLSVDSALTRVERPNGMRGVSVDIRAPHAARLRVKKALLGSIRVLRDYGHDGRVPEQIKNEVAKGPSPSSVVLRRTTVDAQHHIELVLDGKDGATVTADASTNAITLLPGANASGDIVLKLTALADDEPLTPLAASDVVTSAAADDPRALSALTFLTYQEKLLAGSWQYLTYFGRDTLLSTRLLMPVLKPAVIEAALGAVIERLSPDGEVAHEEDIGEWAVMENLKRSPKPSNLRQPGYDYKMVDDDFMLAPVLATYVIDNEAGATRAAAFFARRTTGGRTYAEAVKKNLDRVLAQAAPFAARPSHETLIRIGEGLTVGNWRDSNEGLGKGRVPYDINAALVPAALRAAERLFTSTYLGAPDRASSTRAADLAKVWLSKAEPLFEVRLEADEARRRLQIYATEQNINALEAVRTITGPVTFPGLSLDAKGVPVPIQNSDDGFVMMFTDPSASFLNGAALRIIAPFPAGLRTPVGVVVANPVYVNNPALRAIFTRDHYHGTVIWSWQQALLLSGLRRQIARTDLPADTHRLLEDAEQALARVIEATKANRTSELWSFSIDKAGYHVVPFGQGKGHHTEANAVQLWSTVYLALDRRAGPAGSAGSK